MRLYDEAMQTLTLSALRSEDIWRYMLGPSLETEPGAETWLVFRENTLVGYFRNALHDFTAGLNVNESSRLSPEAVQAVLAKLKQLAVAHDKPFVRLYMPDTLELMQVARRLPYAQGIKPYAWQIHLPNIPRLLGKLGPVLARRLAASPFAGLTRNVVINLYKEAFELCFEEGRLTEAKGLDVNDYRGEVWLPPQLFVPYVLGYRSIDELQTLYPDVSVTEPYLLSILFPKFESYLHFIY